MSLGMSKPIWTDITMMRTPRAAGFIASFRTTPVEIFRVNKGPNKGPNIQLRESAAFPPQRSIVSIYTLTRGRCSLRLWIKLPTNVMMSLMFVSPGNWQWFQYQMGPRCAWTGSINSVWSNGYQDRIGLFILYPKVVYHFELHMANAQLIEELRCYRYTSSRGTNLSPWTYRSLLYPTSYRDES